MIRPIIDATLRTPPDRKMPNIPPINASGRLTKMISASRSDRSAADSSRTMPAITSTLRTAMVCDASSALSNWPL
ncbi:hypothetical protein D3C83_200520 [compost metagenome]